MNGLPSLTIGHFGDALAAVPALLVAYFALRLAHFEWSRDRESRRMLSKHPGKQRRANSY